MLWPIPDRWQTDGVVLLIGVVLSNLCLLGGLFLLYLFTQEVTHDVGVAQRAVLYLLLFPTAFFLSCFYTDAIFLVSLSGRAVCGAAATMGMGYAWLPRSWASRVRWAS